MTVPSPVLPTVVRTAGHSGLGGVRAPCEGLAGEAGAGICGALLRQVLRVGGAGLAGLVAVRGRGGVVCGVRLVRGVGSQRL